MDNRLKIAYLSFSGPGDRFIWSGSHYYMAKALQKHIGDVIHIGPMKSWFESVINFVNNLLKLLHVKKSFSIYTSLVIAWSYAGKVKKELEKHQFDVIFAPVTSTLIAFLKTDIPIVYVSDTTFKLIMDYYNTFKDLMSISKYGGCFIEKLAIKNSQLLLYPTEWAAKSAKADYRAKENKIFTVSFGANLDYVLPKELIFERTKSNKCKLFFIGLDWYRKGGSIAFDTLVELNNLGVDAELTVCGCTPPKEYSHPKLRVIPFLDKNKKEDREVLVDLFTNSNFFILPTRCECFGIVFCEANSFGLPVITTETGGIPDIIKNGTNGFALPFNASGNDYAKIIHDTFKDKQCYMRLIESSRNTFEGKLNWDSWAMSVKKIISRLL